MNKMVGDDAEACGPSISKCDNVAACRNWRSLRTLPASRRSIACHGSLCDVDCARGIMPALRVSMLCWT